MANKRASMREGPLADLFRRTEELESASRARVQEPVEPPPPPHPRETGVPHPGLITTEREDARRSDAAKADEALTTPQERLRQAFSSEIPDDLLQRPLEDEQSNLAAARRVDKPVLRVVGIGGAGCNAVNRMVEAELDGVEFIALNTDVQSLQQSAADTVLHIGERVTRGLGSGADPGQGRDAAMADYDRIKLLLKGSDMIFITAGAGGGTGTGGAPVVARIARELGALTVAIVTKPFDFEGTRRAEQAEQGIAALRKDVDTLIVVPNNRLLSVLDKQTSMVEAFRVADDVLRQGVQGISDLVTLPGLINLDFADVRTVMSDAGNALLGIGMGSGENRAVDAAMQAASSPLLETSMEGAQSILLSVTGGPSLSLWEVNEAASAVAQAAHPEANMIFGAMIDEKLTSDDVWVTVVATGFEQHQRHGFSRYEEPQGEPRVARRELAAPGAGQRPRHAREKLDVDRFDVPEYIPGG